MGSARVDGAATRTSCPAWVEGLEVYRIATTSLRNFRIEDKGSLIGFIGNLGLDPKP